MVIKELLTEEQAMSVNINVILKFFRSQLGKRMLSALDYNDGINREIPFHMKLSALDVNPQLSKDVYENETVLLQGVIDCYFREEDGLVLIDYKTDYATEENMKDIKERYERQICYYTEALSRITGEKVKESYLYLFSNGKIIKY
jgi:ATP-dependent helicase/nuclease subunit A